jgi:hypothetical protein
LAEIIHRSFGEQTNWDDDSDPAVQRLRFLTHSPSNYYSNLLAHARQHNWTRSAVLEEFAAMDRTDSEIDHTPGSAPYLHRQWMQSLRGFNPLTYEFTQPDADTHPSEPPAVESPNVVTPFTGRTRRQVADVVGSADGEQMANEEGGEVVPFPKGREDAWDQESA